MILVGQVFERSFSIIRPTRLDIAVDAEANAFDKETLHCPLVLHTTEW